MQDPVSDKFTIFARALPSPECSLETILVSDALFLLLKEKHSKLNSEVERLQSLVHEKLSLLNNEQPMTADDLKSIVKETVRIYVTEAGSAIQHSVEESQENLMYEFEKSAMDQDARHLCPAKKSALKAKSPSSALSKRKVKAAKPAKG